MTRCGGARQTIQRTATSAAVWLLTLVALMQSSSVTAVVRKYYLGAVEVDWDYAPRGDHTNVAHNSEFYLKGGLKRVGSIYTKTMYKLYTNEKFDEELSMKSWQGIVGAIMRAEVGDTVYVYFHNMASNPVSVHVHGVFYDAYNEGAVYKGKDKRPGDSVAPGDVYEYKWEVKEEAGPAQGDDACIPWPFHSHAEYPDKEINAGLVGVLLVCRKEILNEKGERKDVNREFVVLLKVFDENRSLHAEQNIDWCGDKESCKKLLSEGDKEFYASNYMHSINGYMYAHGSPFSVCGGDTIAWHVLAMGGHSDVHSFTVDGEMLTLGPARIISAEVLPGTFTTAAMTAGAPGKKLVFCAVSNHLEEGESAFLDVHDCGVQQQAPVPGNIRRYYMMVDEYLWDYAPTGMDMYSGTPLISENSIQSKYFAASKNRIGSMYYKYLYFQYEDPEFKYRMSRSGSDKHLGLLGPLIKVEEGETLEVVLYNNASRPFSFFPYGLIPQDKAMDKSGLHSIPVSPKSKWTYVYFVPPAPPQPAGAPPCVTSMYQSAVDPTMDLNSGLVGTILICKPKSINEEQYLKDGYERVLYLAVIDENLSWLIDKNIHSFTVSSEVSKDDHEFWESNRMASINGLSYGNVYGLDFCKYDTVYWHLFSLGDESDVQAAHFHGLNFLIDGRVSDTVSLFPGKTTALKASLKKEGMWVIESTNTKHFEAGMFALYGVDECSQPKAEAYKAEVINPQEKAKEEKKKLEEEGAIRKYFIAAEEIEWDYEPPWASMKSGRQRRSSGGSGEGSSSGSGEGSSSSGSGEGSSDGWSMSSVYKKAVFRQYTDKHFLLPVKREKQAKHLGILGPMIHAQVGDTVEVVFKNKASKPYSLYSHIVETDKENEGAHYNDYTDSQKDDKVEPGESYTYYWKVPTPVQLASPCFSSLYYSAAKFPDDVYSGLVGPLVICQKGVLNPQGVRGDVNQEFALLFMVFDENRSKYLHDNVQTHAPELAHYKGMWSDEYFVSKNKWYTINGWAFTHVPGLEMLKGDGVAWHVFSFGSSSDVHSVHFHGHPLLQEAGGPRVVDTVGVLPEMSKDLLMQAKNEGTWMIHCDVSGHMEMGMVTTYSVKSPLDSLEAKPVAAPPPPEKQLELVKIQAKQQAKQQAIAAAQAQLQQQAAAAAALQAAKAQGAAEALAQQAAQAQAQAQAQAEGKALGVKEAQDKIKELQKTAEEKAAKAAKVAKLQQLAAAEAAVIKKAEVDAKNDAGLKPVVIESKAEDFAKDYSYSEGTYKEGVEYMEQNGGDSSYDEWYDESEEWSEDSQGEGNSEDYGKDYSEGGMGSHSDQSENYKLKL